MPDHDPSTTTALDSRGDKLWNFSFTYELPTQPTDGRNWFNAIAVVDEEINGSETDQAWGTLLVDNDKLLFSVSSEGRYSEAFELARVKVLNALSQGGLAVSQLVEINYVDPDEPLDTLNAPF